MKFKRHSNLFVHFLNLLLTITFLTSCDNITNYKLNVSYNYSSTTYLNISAEEIVNKLENNQNFALFVSNPNCSSCRTVDENLTKYIQEKHTTIYKYEYNQMSYSYLNEEYPNIFSFDYVSPNILLFNNKNYYSLPYSSMMEYKNLKATLNGRIKNNNSYTLITKEEYLSFLDNNKNLVIFTYDNREYMDYFNLIQNQILASKKNTLLLNLNNIEDELLNYLQSELTTVSEYLLINKKDNHFEIYEYDKENNIDQIINDFYLN